jgi:tRNA modification GTPase
LIGADELASKLSEAANQVARLAEQMKFRGQSSAAVRMVLAGWGNVGKSSLFNALLGRDEAITASQPGTTRDYLCAHLNLDGIACELIDTAGVEPCPREDSVALAAQEMASAQRSEAHVRVLCIDSSRPLCPWECVELQSDHPGKQLVVLTKVDLPRATDLPQAHVQTSSRTGEGITALRAHLRDAAWSVLHGGTCVESHGAVAATGTRCQVSLRLAAKCLARAQRVAVAGLGDELVAAELRTALAELGKVVGTVYTDDVLDHIFSRFCIGK